jgi:hypothetical protein
MKRLESVKSLLPIEPLGLDGGRGWRPFGSIVAARPSVWVASAVEFLTSWTVWDEEEFIKRFAGCEVLVPLVWFDESVMLKVLNTGVKVLSPAPLDELLLISVSFK